MCPFNKLISKKHLDSTRFFRAWINVANLTFYGGKAKKTGTFSGRAWLQNVCGGGSRGECPWQCRCGWRYWQDEGLLPRLKKMLADGGYKGRKLADTVRQKLGAEFTVVLRPDESPKKFSVLPLRCIVERSFSWLENFRRIAIDHEFYSDTRRWFSSPSADSCITNYATEI